MLQSAIPLSGEPALQAHVDQAAVHLIQAAGALACYLSLTANAGRHPRILAVAGDKDVTKHLRSELSPLLRRANAVDAPRQTQLDGKPVLAIPLVSGASRIGTALLVYATHTEIDEQRALAATALTGTTLDAARQLAVLHMEAEEIAERARVREIQASRNLIRGIIDSIPLGLALLDGRGTVLAANRALANRFGIDPTVLVGMSYSTVIGPWEVSPAAQTFANSQANTVRRETHRHDGAKTLLELTSFPLFDTDGRTMQVAEVWEDITERVALQTQLVRAEKLAAIGQLAASIAHEVGNPLQAIQGFLSLFLEQSPDDTPNRQYLELAGEEIERIVHVIARLRDLYRPRAEVISTVQINKLIENVLLITGKQLERTHVALRVALAPQLPAVQAIADQLKQVLLNLVLNAIEAMRDGGTLLIRTEANTTVDEGTYVIVNITDTGVGIAPDYAAHIFDGLHTTKERGMGLGLHTSKAIIERHKGQLTVQSVVGEGTTFTITLPIGNEEEEL